jgi:hypothetical protein
MYLLPPFLSFALSIWWFRRLRFGWRLAFCSATIAWGLMLTFLTEALSVLHLITRNGLGIGWSLFCISAFLLIWFTPKPSIDSHFEDGCAEEKFTAADCAMLVGIAFILGVTAFNAIVAPPNTDDVMEYHLPRVVLWASNQSVQFFPTFDFAQLIHTPWAEFAALHIYVLSGSDRLLNLIEWFSFFGCIVGASLIAKFLGAGNRGQLVASVLVATIPELILESSGSNNTAVGAYWIAIAVVILLRGGRSPEPLFVFLAAGALGLAVLTKGTALVMLVGVLAAVWVILRPTMTWLLAARLGALLSLVLLVNAPQFLRNMSLTGHPLGLPYPEAGNRMRFGSETFSPAAVFSGVLRNSALHLMIPSAKANAVTESIVRRLIYATGTDPGDPRTTWEDNFYLPGFTTREYFTGNPGQFLLIVGVFVLGVVRWRSVSHAAVWMLAGLAFSFILFCAVLMWNPSSARYHLPLFICAAGALGVLLPNLMPRPAILGIAALALVSSLPFVFDNGLRSLIPENRTSVFRNSRDALYFMDDFRQSQFGAFAQAADEVARSGCREVGIDGMLQSYVYPEMALIQQRVSGVRFQYTGVENPTLAFGSVLRRHAPCVVVCLGCMRIPGKWKEYQWLVQHPAVFGDDNVVFWRGARGGTLSPDHVATSDQPTSAPELADRIRLRYTQLLALPEFAKVGQDFALDSPFQDSRGAVLKANRDAVYELRLRARIIWNWSEPLRNRAAGNVSTVQDMQVLQIVDDAYPQLTALVRARYSTLADGFASESPASHEEQAADHR